RLPFDAASAIESAMQRITKPPSPLESAFQDIPGDLVATVTRCLATSRDARWPDAQALRAALSLQDEDADDGDVSLRFVRIGAFVVPAALIANGWVAVFSA